MFQGCHLGVFMAIVYKAPVSLTRVFKSCCSPDLERADFGRQSFQYTWLNSYFFSSFRESIETKHTQLLGTIWQLRDSKEFVTTTQPKPPILSLVTYCTLVQSYQYCYPIDSRHLPERRLHLPERRLQIQSLLPLERGHIIQYSYYFRQLAVSIACPLPKHHSFTQDKLAMSHSFQLESYNQL